MTRPHPLALCAALLLASLASLAILITMMRGPATPSLPSPPPDQLTECKSNLRVLASSLRFYSEDHQGHYPKSLSQLVPHYLGSIPKCAGARQERYSAGYRSSAHPDRYVIACCGRNHDQEGLGPNLPAFSSESGFLYSRPPGEHRAIACQARLVKMAALVEGHLKHHGRLPRSLLELPSPFPTDFDYTIVANKHFRLNCSALSHAHEGLQPNEPAFDSQVGLVPCSAPPPEFVASLKSRESLQPKIPLPLCIPVFIFVLFILWPFEASGKRHDDLWVNQSESGWKMIVRKRPRP